MRGLSSGGRFVVMGVPENLDAASRRAIRSLQPGGFILFGRNIGLPPVPDAQGRLGVPGSPEQLHALIEELRSLVDHEPVICLDQEGGRVSRLRGLEGGAEPPSARDLVACVKADLIRRHGRLTGRLLRLFGINLDLCPVLDVAYDRDADNSLQNRCWGATPEQVSHNAGLFNRALRAEGVLSCGKHSPGYSRASVNPHHELPVIHASRAEMEKDWLPYRQLLPELDFVMTGHAFYPALDSSGVPTSLSGAIVSGVLRGELGFRGWVVSDDLDMGAITRHVGLEEAVTRAVRAGTDQILLCHDIGRAHDAARAIGGLSSAVLNPGLRRLDALQERLKPAEKFSRASFRSINRGIRELRAAALGPGAPRFSRGAGKMGAIEAARLSPVNVVGDRRIGAPAEYAPPRRRRRS